MRDAVQGSTLNVAALVEEIVAKRKPRGEQFRQSSYPGLRHRTSAHKYRNAEYVQQGFGRVRKLMASEMLEFQAAVQRCIDAKDAA